MAWRRPGDKPLSEPRMESLLTHICVTRPQWVKSLWSTDDIWWLRYGSTLVKSNRTNSLPVLVYCQWCQLTLNLRQLCRKCSRFHLLQSCENYIFRNTAASPRGQWVHISYRTSICIPCHPLYPINDIFEILPCSNFWEVFLPTTQCYSITKRNWPPSVSITVYWPRQNYMIISPQKSGEPYFRGDSVSE